MGCFVGKRITNTLYFDHKSSEELCQLLTQVLAEYENLRFDKGIAKLISEFAFVSKLTTDDRAVNWRLSPKFELQVDFQNNHCEKYHGIMLDVKDFKGIRFNTLKNKTLHFGFGVGTKEAFKKATTTTEGWQRWDGMDAENYVLFDNHYCSFQRRNWGSYCGIGHITQLDLLLNEEENVWVWKFYDRKGHLLGTERTDVMTAETVYPIIVVSFCGWFMSTRVNDDYRTRKAELSVEFL